MRDTFIPVRFMFNLPQFFRKTPKPQNVIVLDLGTHSVKALILNLTTFTPTVIGYGREFYKEGSILSGLVSDLEDFVRTTKRAVRQASLECGFAPRDLVFSLSGEFAKAINVDLIIHREKEGRLKDAEQRKIEGEVEKMAEREIQGEFTKVTGNPRSEFRIFEKRLLSLQTLNGIYLDGFDSIIEKSFKASFQVSFATLQTGRLLKHLVGEIKKNLWFSTSQIGNLVCLARKSFGSFKGVLVDIGGQVTDVVLVNEGRILGVRTIPLGGKDFSQLLSAKKNLTFEEAERKKISSEFEKSDIEDLLTFLLNSLEMAILDLAPEFPKSFFTPIYLFGDGSKLSHLKSCFRPEAGDFPGKGAGILKNLELKDFDSSHLRGLLAVKEERFDGFSPILATGAQVLDIYVSNKF